MGRLSIVRRSLCWWYVKVGELSIVREYLLHTHTGSRRARNRWLVAYTLVRSLSLTKYTVLSLSVEAAKKEG